MLDMVPHKRLKYKMRLYGLDGKVLGWLSDFLSKRKMRVCVREAQSEWRDVTSSVPQGSVGGPTYFSVFIDDMANDISSRMIQFADDTKLWKIINNEEDRNELQRDLESLEDWSNKWLLKFNPKKCEVLHLGSNNKKYQYAMKENELRTILDDTTLEKDLGVLISQDLKIAEQCNKAAKKAMRVLGMVRRTCRNLAEATLKILYCSFIRPHLITVFNHGHHT
jgi:hypothetical protein